MSVSTLTKIVAVSALALSGCATVRIPVDRDVRASRVCGEMAGRGGCAPTVGTRMPFSQRYRNITVSDGTQPDILSYLGRTVGINDNTGNAGSPCGFTSTDQPELPSQQSDFKLSYSVADTLKSSFAADIDQALNLAQIPSAVRDRLDAKVSAAASAFDNQTIEVTAQVAEHQLLTTSLDRLDARDNLTSLQAACADRIASGNYRLVQAVTALYDAVGLIEAALRSEAVSEATIAGVKADLTSRARAKLDIAVKPYYSVIGVSFWTPQLLTPSS